MNAAAVVYLSGQQLYNKLKLFKDSSHNNPENIIMPTDKAANYKVAQYLLLMLYFNNFLSLSTLSNTLI